jgi:hypothetical protein
MTRAAFLAVLVAGLAGACDESVRRGDGSPRESGAGDTGGAREVGARDVARTDGGDTYLPWEGGSSYYATWTHGPSTDPSFFPIAVWLQSESNAQKYKDIGVNTFVGLWEGPTEAQLSALTKVGMPAICAQSGVWASHLSDPMILSWMHDDEPDNAQPDGKGGYLPCIDPSVIVTRYTTFKSNDATRPVFLNLGQGVANVDWVGRGTCTGKVAMYPEYAKGADILSFDVYPVNNNDASHNQLWLVASGVDRLRQASSYKKIVWNWIEVTAIDAQPASKPTPQQVKAEVWMSLIHGSMGIGYFCHIIGPPFTEAGLLADTTMTSAVAAINAQIKSLAPALNTPSLSGAVKVVSSNTAVPIDTMVKRQGGALYLFTVAMRTGATTATFTLPTVPSGSVEVLGEARSLTVAGNTFSDAFAASHAVHLYKITP